MMNKLMMIDLMCDDIELSNLSPNINNNLLPLLIVFNSVDEIE